MIATGGQPPGSIEGMVVDPQGRPLADVTVVIKTGDQPHPDIGAVSGDDGSFSFEGLTGGNYVLAAYAESGVPTEVSVSVQPGRASSTRLMVTR